MGGSGDGGVGSVGTQTNKPAIDSGTFGRIQHIAPKDRLKPQAGKSTPDYFDVSRLLPVLDALNWTEGKRFMKFWIDGKACTARTDPKVDDKATISANVDNACMRVLTIKWDWLLSFAEAKRPYDSFVKEKLFNDAAVRQLIKSYGPAGGAFGDFLKDGLKPEDFLGQIKEHQIQSMAVDVAADPSRLNDETAAMANFGYFAMYQGESFRIDQLEKNMKDMWPYLGPLNLLPPGPYPLSKKDDDAWFDRLKERWKAYEAILFIKAAGVYAGDIYEFGGFQYLGRWDLVHKTVGGNWATFALTRLHNAPAPDATVVDVENALFRKYREKTGKGGDFLVFTPIRMTSLNPPRMIPVPHGR